jgi:hypothetical protein
MFLDELERPEPIITGRKMRKLSAIKPVESELMEL